MGWNLDTLDTLAEEIIEGRCVAFVGAGFSAPVCRGWRDLLLAAADSAPGARASIRELLKSEAPSARELETAAQLLEDAVERTKLASVIAAHTRNPHAGPERAARVEQRCKWLLEIPFAAVLTTNFDDVLRGGVLREEAYEKLLRRGPTTWWHRRHWDRSHDGHVLKLHGDLQSERGVTLSRRGYRNRLYAEPGYLAVLRSLFLTKTILFLGFSFTDEYLNELRSEVLSYLTHGAHTPTLAYAILADVPEPIRAHYKKHEGIEVFDYDSKGNKDHSPFDDLLAELHARTNPAALLGARLEGKRIVWMDPAPWNDTGRDFLTTAAKGHCTIEMKDTPEEALAALGAPCDLVVTRWGHSPSGSADAVTLLEGMRARDLRAPVIVFASGDHADENRERAMRLGALEYTSHWETFFQAIDHRFAGPPKPPRARRG